MSTDSDCNSKTPPETSSNTSVNNNNSNSNNNNQHNREQHSVENTSISNEEMKQPSISSITPMSNNFKTTTTTTGSTMTITSNVHSSSSHDPTPPSSSTILPPLSSLQLFNLPRTTANHQERKQVYSDSDLRSGLPPIMSSTTHENFKKQIITNSTSNIGIISGEMPQSPLSTHNGSKESLRSSASSDDPNKIQTCTLHNLPTFDSNSNSPLSMEDNSAFKHQMYKEQFKKYVTQYKRRYKKVVISKTPEQQKTILTKLLNFQGGQFFSNLQHTQKNHLVIQACMQEGDQVLDLAVLVTRKRISAKPKLEDFSFNMVVLSNSTTLLPRTHATKSVSFDSTSVDQLESKPMQQR
ncbi:hypothetical protein C9374_013039 [Naegleria lovaniensis]|uniref:Uncharacterized protein n=1 Tax=Naegleria lovaniensis TaxID=51637 RepID=A0AA88G6V8_NAELO|nr:uncharacterized protein C9374_013039 [Naegleria lovaniensis]KAG2372917.1 hypothetical protein C9374_013039 [Naegleria lovaniensis]